MEVRSGNEMSREILAAFMIIVSSLLFFVGDVQAETAAFCSWKQLNDDYKDTDADGEEDDYESFNVGEYLHIFDTLVDYETMANLGYTILTLNSLPEEKVVFGNTLDSTVQKGKGIMMRLHIVKDTEMDGDQCEYYIVDSVTLYVKEDGPNDGSSAMDKFSSIVLGVGICCGPEIVVLIILAISIQQKMKKKRAAEAKMWSEPPTTPAPQTPSPPVQSPAQPPQPAKPARSRTGNLWNEGNPSLGQPGILQPPPDLAANRSQQSTNDDMKGLEDFMKGIQAEGSDVDFVIKADGPEKTIPAKEGGPPVDP
jgi:hypothetical protein